MADPQPSRTGKDVASPTPDQVHVELQRELAVAGAIADGKSFAEAAELAGYADKTGAWRAYWRLMSRAISHEADRVRVEIGGQADATLQKYLPRLLEGDASAWPVVKGCWERLAKLFGADAPVVHDMRISAEIVAEIQQVTAEINSRVMRVVGE